MEPSHTILKLYEPSSSLLYIERTKIISVGFNLVSTENYSSSEKRNLDVTVHTVSSVFHKMGSRRGMSEVDYDDKNVPNDDRSFVE